LAATASRSSSNKSAYTSKRHVHPAAQHVEIAYPQRRHLTPPQAGVGQEPDDLRIAINGSC
jgi:hypothetical protein